MTTDTWLLIVQTIISLMALIVAIRASRTNQPRQTPVANHPPSTIQRIGRWMNREATWVLAVSALISLWNLVSVFRSPKPLDRWMVLLIAFSLSAIMLNVAVMLFLFALRDYHERYTKKEFVEEAKLDLRLLNIISDLSQNTHAADQGILDLVRTLVDTKTSSTEKTSVAANALPAERPTQDTFDRIRSAIKRLLE